MSHRFKYVLLTVGLCALLAPFLESCDMNAALSRSQQPTPTNRSRLAPEQVTACRGTLRRASAADAPSLLVPRSIYFGTTEGDLYAVNAQTGSLRWCINIITTNNSQVFVGTPAAVDGVVYVCVSPSLDDHTGSLYALNASDGAMRWRSKTDCVINSIGFGDSGLPLVSNGVVYSGFYAVREQDGVPLWKVSSALGLEIVFLAVSNGILYGSTPWYVFALNASNGSMHWRYPPYKFGIGSAQLVSDQLLMVGTQEPVDQQTSALYALNAETGTLRWYFLMGSYTGAAFLNNVVYVGAGDGYLYAFDAGTGKVLWHDHFNYGAFTYAAFDPTLTTNGVLYINSDGAYALRSDTGSVLWHNPLGTSGNVYITPSVADDVNYFNPSVVAGGIDYLTSTNGRITTLYALNASTGEELWRSQKFPQVYSQQALA